MEPKLRVGLKCQGGQHVNTSDSRVELSWSIATSRALTDEQRERLLQRLGHRLTSGVLTRRHQVTKTQRSETKRLRQRPHNE